MRLSELLGRQVRDSTGRRLGTIVDVRLCVGGDLDDAPELPRIFGFVVSPHTASSYLGYERSETRNPRLLAALLRWRHRDTFLALWPDIAEIGEAEVVLQDYTRYSPVLTVRD
jgi:hypothetical protein